MLYKQISHEIKDIDDKKGIVVAYANAYNNEDSDGDISEPGSFIKTVAEHRKRFRVLKDHNSTISLGVPLDVDANDSFGLLTTTQFNMDKQVSKDMYSDIKLYIANGLNAELSIGYEPVKRKDNDKKRITEYKLYEYSFLTSWAANELATVQGVKNLKSHYGILDLLTKAYDMDYSDPRLKQIEAILISLSKAEPEESTPHDEPKKNAAILQELNQLFKH